MQSKSKTALSPAEAKRSRQFWLDQLRQINESKDFAEKALAALAD